MKNCFNKIIHLIFLRLEKSHTSSLFVDSAREWDILEKINLKPVSKILLRESGVVLSET